MLALAFIALFAVIAVSIAGFADVTFKQQLRTEATAASDSLIEGAAAYSVADANRPDWSCVGKPVGSVTMTDGKTLGYSTSACLPFSFGQRFAKFPCTLCALSTTQGNNGISDAKLPVLLPDPGAVIITNSSLSITDPGGSCPYFFAAGGGIQYNSNNAAAPTSSGGAVYAKTNITGSPDGTLTKNLTTATSPSLFTGAANYVGQSITDLDPTGGCEIPAGTTIKPPENNVTHSVTLSNKATGTIAADTFTIATPAAPTARTTTLKDPLAFLQSPLKQGLLNGLPNVGSVSPPGGSILHPGIYSLIAIGTNSTIYLDPGVYAIAGGATAQFSVAGGANVYVNCGTDPVPVACSGAQFQGQPGVLLYFLCGTSLTPAECATPQPAASFMTSGGGTIDLRSQTTGPFANIAVFYDRNDTSQFNITGGGTYVFSGGTYVPASQFILQGNGVAAGFNGPIIASYITLGGSGTGRLNLGGLGAGPFSCVTMNNGLTTSTVSGSADGIVAAGSTVVTSASLFTGSANYAGQIIVDSLGDVPVGTTVVSENNATHQATLSTAASVSAIGDKFSVSALTGHDAVQTSTPSGQSGGSCIGGAQIVALNYAP